MKLFSKNSFLFIFCYSIALMHVFAQGEVTRSGNTWSARVNGSTVYTGVRMFDAVNAACSRAGNGATIHIRNSGDSGDDGGKVYAIRPLEGQTLDFHNHTVNCNSNGDLAVAVHADKKDGITLMNLKVTGSPRYGIWFRGCSDVTLTNITMDLDKNNPVGLGIRVDASTAPASNLTINGTTTVNGSKGHGIETYGLNGVSIGDVTVTNTGGCGLLLNESQNCSVGVVTGNYNCYGGGYATFRVANDNGSTHVKGVYSRNSGRGFFSVSGSHDCTIDWVDIANSTSQGIFLEDATNTHVLSGSVSNGNPNVQFVRTKNCSVNLSEAQCNACGSGIADGQVYRITPRHDESKSIELFNSESVNNANVEQGSFLEADSQQWLARDRGDGFWSFHPVTDLNSAMYVSVRSDENSNVGVYKYEGDANQQFYFSNAGSGGWVRIKSKLKGNCIDVKNGTSEDGANIVQMECLSNHTNQMFRFDPIAVNSKLAKVNLNEEMLKTEEFSIYPNPTQNTLNLQLAEEPSDAAFYQIFDVNGRLLSSAKIFSVSTQLDVIFLESGTYIVLINDQGKVLSKKISIK
ncbi:RICIN domain-containing protein [Fulvivirga sediminis]|uniref:RICIN domain-containing protein n=1 Tax=Fulvivirga sediminis TaxID=2803949 RepID=A0A937F8F5_9BACT|nr:RICIN domain-containing protein [Fulvivirga sediminis]MBL3657061.1 RICIN domain-containing protein [Fulvivirga sediminis]